MYSISNEMQVMAVQIIGHIRTLTIYVYIDENTCTFVCLPIAMCYFVSVFCGQCFKVFVLVFLLVHVEL